MGPSNSFCGRRAKRLFVVVQDVFLAETARLADVVLPAAMWGEKTGTFTNVAGEVGHKAEQIAHRVMNAAHRERSHVADYLGLLQTAHNELAAACDYLREQHKPNAEVREGALLIGDFSRQAFKDLEPFIQHYGTRKEREPQALRKALFPRPRAGGFGLLRDLHALADEVHVATKIIKDAARELRDDALYELCLSLYERNQRQQAWADTMIKESAAQSVVVPS